MMPFRNQRLGTKTYRHLVREQDLYSSQHGSSQSPYQCSCHQHNQTFQRRKSHRNVLKRSRPFSTEASRRHHPALTIAQLDDKKSPSPQQHEQKWRSMTNKLLTYDFLASPPLDRKAAAQQWQQAEACLQYWHKQKNLEQCLKLLNHLEAYSPSSSRSIPTESILNPIVKLWRNQLQLLPSEMSKKLKKFQACGLVKMDKATHSMILDAASRQKDPKEGVLFGHAYLSEWIKKYQENSETTKPDAVAVGSVIHAWVESGLQEAPHRAVEWMKICTDLLELQPTTQLYTSVIAAWANVGNSHKAQEWMNRMIDENGVDVVDLAAWNGLLLAYAQSSSKSHSKAKKTSESPAQKAEGVLKQMIRLYDTRRLLEAPDVVSYTIVLDAWSKQVNKETNPKQKRQSAQRAFRLLQQMKESPDPNVRPNTISYNSVLTTCARAGLVSEAESLLKEMIHEYTRQNNSTTSAKLHNDIKSTIEPNIQSMAILLHAYSRSSNDPTLAAQKAESILTDSLPALGLKPNLQIYNNCLSCWGKASSPESFLPVERATALFREISELYGMQPDVVTYTALMNVWGRHGKPYEAETLLDELWELFLNSKQEEAHLYKPTGQTLTTVLHAWSSQDPEQTEALLQRMAQDYGVSPNVYSYSVVLTAWAKHSASEEYPDAPDRALAILNGMEEYGGIQPNVVSYSTVIQAFSEQGRAKEAEALLQKMLSSSEDDSATPKPDMYTFSSVLYAWSKSRSPHAAERAEAILVRMLQMYLSGGLDQPPNVYCYTNVLVCLANSRKKGSAERALQILRSMQQNYADASNTMAAPNLVSYNSVINAFANEIGRGGARAEVELMVEQVFDLLEELQSFGKTNPKLRPDKWTYLSACKAIRNVRTRRNNLKHVNRLLASMNKEGFEPTRELKKQIQVLMR